MAEKKKVDLKSASAKTKTSKNEPASISLGGSNKKQVSKKGLESLSYSDYYKKYLESKKDNFELLAKKASTDTIKNKEEIKDEIKAEAFYADSALEYTKELKEEKYSDHFKKLKNIDEKRVVISNEMQHDKNSEKEGEFVVRNKYHPSFNDVVVSNQNHDIFNDDQYNPSLGFNQNQKPFEPRVNGFDKNNQPIYSRMYIPRGYVRPINPYNRPPFNPYFNPYQNPYQFAPYFYPPYPGFNQPFNNQNPFQNPYAPAGFNQLNKQDQSNYTQQLMDFDPFASTAELTVVDNQNQSQNNLVVAQSNKQPELSHIIHSFNKRMKEQLRIVAKQNEMIERLQTKVIELTEEKATALIEQTKLSTEDFLPTTENNFEAVVREEEKPALEEVVIINQATVEADNNQPVQAVEYQPTSPTQEVVKPEVELSLQAEADDQLNNVWSFEIDDLIDTEKLDEELAAFEEFDTASVDDELDLSLLDDEIINTIQPQIKYEASQAQLSADEPIVDDEKSTELDIIDDYDLDASTSEEIYTPQGLFDLNDNSTQESKNSIVPTQVIDEMFNEEKTDPSRRFWESFVGNSDYGFYNNKTWNWKGKFSKLQKWIPFTHEEEVPFYGTKHVILSAIKSSERKKFWKELIGDPVYGHFEGSSKVWIWHGVFDQELNWIPDPTHEFKTEEEVLAQKQKQSFPKKKDPKKPAAPKVLKTTEITPESDLHKMLLDDPRYKKHIGNEEYGYYDNDGIWIWTGHFDEDGSFKPDKVEFDLFNNAQASESNFSSLFESWKKNNQNNLEFEAESRRFKPSKTSVVYVDEQEQPEDEPEVKSPRAELTADEVIEFKPQQKVKNELVKSYYQKSTDEEYGILTWDKAKIHDDAIVDASVLDEWSSNQAPFWLEFVGNEKYGHYNTNNDWVFDGYFDDDYEFIPSNKHEVTEQLKQTKTTISRTSILEEDTNLDEYFKPASKEEFIKYEAKPTEELKAKKQDAEPFFNQFIGDQRYGFYNKNNVWVWNGYFDENQNFISDSTPTANKLLEEVELQTKQEVESTKKTDSIKFVKPTKSNYKTLHQFVDTVSELPYAEIKHASDVVSQEQLVQPQTQVVQQEVAQQEVAQPTVNALFEFKPTLAESSIVQPIVQDSVIEEVSTINVDINNVELATDKFEPQSFWKAQQTEVSQTPVVQAVQTPVTPIAISPVAPSVAQPIQPVAVQPQVVQPAQQKPAFEFKSTDTLTISPVLAIAPTPVEQIQVSAPAKPVVDVFATKEIDLANVEINLVDQVTADEALSVDVSQVELVSADYQIATTREPVVQPQAHEEVQAPIVQPTIADEELSAETVNVEVASDVIEQEVAQATVEQALEESFSELEAELAQKQELEAELEKLQQELEALKQQTAQIQTEPTTIIEGPAQAFEKPDQVSIDAQESIEAVVGEQTAQQEVDKTTTEQEVQQDTPVEEDKTTVEQEAQQDASLEEDKTTTEQVVEKQEAQVAEEDKTTVEQEFDEEDKTTVEEDFEEEAKIFERKTEEQQVQLELDPTVELEDEPVEVQTSSQQQTQQDEELVSDLADEEELTVEEAISEEEQPEEDKTTVEQEVQAEPEVQQDQEVEELAADSEAQQEVEEQEEVEQPVEEEAEEFWMKLVGDENYGHYNEDEEWIWDGYFDENQEFVRNEEEVEQTALEQEQPEEFVSDLADIETSQEQQEEQAADEAESVEEAIEEEVQAEQADEEQLEAEQEVEQEVQAEEVEQEVVEEEAEYWEQFVGNDQYGHYDENEEWIWDGYFDEEQNFFRNDEADQQEQSADEQYEASADESLEEAISEEEVSQDQEVEAISQEDQPEPEIIDFASGLGDSTAQEEAQQEADVEQSIEEEQLQAQEEVQEEAQQEAQEDQEVVEEEVEYWEQFVGNDQYGHYDENEEWIWDGYFDEENNFFRNDEEQVEAQPEEESVEEQIQAEEQQEQEEVETISEDEQPEPEIIDFSSQVEEAAVEESEEVDSLEPIEQEELEADPTQAIDGEEFLVQSEESAQEEYSEQPADEQYEEVEAEYQEEVVEEQPADQYEESVEEVVEEAVEEYEQAAEEYEQAAEEYEEEQPADEEGSEEAEQAEGEEVEEVEVEGEHWIYADENGEINFDDYIGNENFGYYLEDGEWEWYEGDFDENGNWFVYVQGDPEEVDIEADIPVFKGVDTDSVDADDWLSQFDEDAAAAIFDKEEGEDDDDDYDFLDDDEDDKKKAKKKKDKKKKKE
ncbi:EAGR box-containing protein [Mycoplasma sp. E35C]|uniref:EAGR box-containing protein n=1 Tax=Mycoplasma sp. E35C TaxID=2801918 RepID=UPI001CA42461|nr:EAGR box-containing protein [Mycoplasma sp. E35C]QZX48936.1 EAGR box-containing protein [Mycoplasma sp. E35C]